MKKHTMIKICGLQSVEIVESMVNLSVDCIGFVFAKSKRQVTPEQAAKLISVVRSHHLSAIQTAGVFVDPQVEQLTRILEEAPLDVVQLHGQETPEYCRWVKETFPVKVCKVFSVRQSLEKDALEQLLDPYAGCMDSMLLDTYDPVIGGGTGQPFAWDCIPLFQEWSKNNSIPLIVAGGLNLDNVGELITEFHPDGVDVSSGVETEGVKDIQKITAFVERVRQYDHSS